MRTPDDIAGHRFTRSKGPVQCDSMGVMVWLPDTSSRWPGARPEQQINAGGLSKIFICISHHVGFDTNSFS